MVQVHGLLEEEVSSVDPKPYKMVKEFYHSCMNQPVIEVRLKAISSSVSKLVFRVGGFNPCRN